MTQKEMFRVVVGLMILGSLAIGRFVTPYAPLFTVFIGLNMIQSAFTLFCPLDKILKATGKPECPDARSAASVR
ncbi:MAG: DUF2892 domain-containing protein [Candidatus Eisenbacteria bacterium]